jgi:hypothetical protein
MKPNLVQLLTLAGCLTLSANTASAALFIYESFNQTIGNLNGQAGGTGLSGNWSASATQTGAITGVIAGTSTYGNLASAGGRLVTGSAAGGQSNSTASISTGSTLQDAGAMTDGNQLWFSFIYTVPITTSTNNTFDFAIGTTALSATGTMGAGQSGIGVTITRNNRVSVAAWDNARTLGTQSGTTNNAFTAGTSHLRTYP